MSNTVKWIGGIVGGVVLLVIVVSVVYSSWFKTSTPTPVRVEATLNPNTHVPLDGSRINTQHPCWYTTLVDGKEVAVYVGPIPATPLPPTDPAASPPLAGGGASGAAGVTPAVGTSGTGAAAPAPDPSIVRRIMTHEARVREIVTAEFGDRFEPVNRRTTAVETGIGTLQTAMTDGFNELKVQLQADREANRLAFEQVNTNISGLGDRLSRLEGRTDAIERRVDAIHVSTTPPAPAASTAPTPLPGGTL